MTDERLGKERAKKWRELTTVKGRRELGLMLLDSVNLVREAIELGLVRELAAVPGRHEEILAAYRASGGKVLEADEAMLARATDVETSAGIAAVAAVPKACEAGFFEKEAWTAAYLDQVADPGNVGTVARAAAAFGVDVLVLSPGSADPFGPKALRASAGALLRLPVVWWERASKEIPELRRARFFRAVVRGGEAVDRVRFSARSVLWLGNEAHGAGTAPAGIDVVDVTIPMARGTESLNVGAAAAVLFYERARALSSRG